MVIAIKQRLSKSGKHPILIYYSIEKSETCFKFCHIKTNLFSHSYVCLGFKEAKNAGNAIYVKSVRVNRDYSEFLSDPKKLLHKCIELGFTFD
jgi:hypothetical protein